MAFGIRPTGAKATGYICEFGESGIVRECDTFTCQHCNRIVPVPPMAAANDMPGGQCWGCMGLICNRCVGKGGCDHIEKKLERQERRGRWHREYEDVVRR